MASGAALTGFRILTFRASREELRCLDYRHLALGLFCTWIVGIGRWWDDPDAHLLLHLGLGSLIYVFALSLLLWLIIWPLRPSDWSYRNVLTYVSLTSPPAILYALPVERWYGLDVAATLNLWFLAVVAGWRVALLVVYLSRLGRLSGGAIAAAALLPIMLIIVTLTALNLERAVFQIMGGLRERTANDYAYAILFLLTVLSMWGAVPVLILYLTYVYQAWARRENSPIPQ